MQSGLLYDKDRHDPFSAMVQLHLADDVLPVILGVMPTREPGLDFEYNNLNSQLLALVLERATTTRYARLLSQRIWQPIGAGDASVWLDRDGGTARAYCCVFGTARDWARVGELIRNRGVARGRQVVSARWIDAMTQPTALESRYGLHVWVRSAGAGVPAFIKVDGKSEQRVYVLPRERLVIVRTGENASAWDDEFLPKALAAAIVPE